LPQDLASHRFEDRMRGQAHGCLTTRSGFSEPWLDFALNAFLI